MRHRRRNWLVRRLVLGFAIALVVVPVAQARPEGALPPLAAGGANTQGMFVQGVDDFPGSSELAPDVSGAPVRGEVKDGVGTSPGSVVIVGDDKRGLPAVSVVPVGHPDNRGDGTSASPATIRIVVPSDAGAAPVVNEPVQVVSNPSNGFDWGDAGIGAGTVLAVMLLGAGALLAARHVGRPASV